MSKYRDGAKVVYTKTSLCGSVGKIITSVTKTMYLVELTDGKRHYAHSQILRDANRYEKRRFRKMKKYERRF